MNEAKAIKRHAAQHDLFNRLHSIAADEAFVRGVAQDWFENRFQVVANQRCGTWYCDPKTSSPVYAYFKSTDGHTHNWDFNLRRSNLSLAKFAEDKGGFILVDSTRRGKRMPDGLSKTVPIWCAVVNRALKMRRERTGAAPLESWDTELYLPGQIVSPSERAQIEAKLDAWADALEASVLPLPELTRPLRPFFIHPSTSVPPEIPTSPSYTPIICLSASRWVNEPGGGDRIPTATRIGDGVFSRTVAFEYVPGAGDDDELWGRGLKPGMYHEAKEDLLSTPREDLSNAVDDLVKDMTELSRAMRNTSLEEKAHEPQSGALGWPDLTPVSSALVIDLGPPIANPEVSTEARPIATIIRIVEVVKPVKELPFVLPVQSTAGHTTAVLALPSSRTHAKEYLNALSALKEYVERQATGGAVLLSPGREEELEAAKSRHQTPDQATSPLHLSPASQLTASQLQASKKMILPVAVALLCSLPHLDDEEDDDGDEIDKSVVADRLHRLVAHWPDGNPPRAALKRVNEFLMSEERN